MYINSSGTLQQKQSFFRLSLVSELFWAILNFFGLFFSTLFGNPIKGQLKVDVSGQVAGVVAVVVGLDIQVNVQGVLVTGRNVKNRQNCNPSSGGS